MIEQDEDIVVAPIAEELPDEEAPRPAIGTEEIQKAIETLGKYRRGKAGYDQKIVNDEQWYQLRHWGDINAKSQSHNKERSDQVNPKSAWLFSTLTNKTADAMDQYPCAAVRPREESDQQEAKILTSILPCVLDQNGFEAVYDAVQDSKFKYGVGVYGIFWNQDKLNGLGDIEITRCDVLNLYWEPGKDDIQKSPNFFSISLEDTDQLVQRYPQLKGQTGNNGLMPRQYQNAAQEEDLLEKSVVVDWYYKKWQGGKMVLHYCKFCGNTVIYATENDTEPVLDAMGNVIREPRSEVGLYAHGLYPFVFDRLYRMEGSPCGVSIIDIGKSPQMFIDLLGKAFKENALANAKPRWLVRKDGQINEEEFADTTNSLVHFNGSLSMGDSIIPLQGSSIPGVYMQLLEQTIDELKETSGNRDVSTGGSTGGVTAAAGIAAMQEASAKLSRYSSKVAYRSFADVVKFAIELIREDYDYPRAFRIVGKNAAEQFVMYDNTNLKVQEQMGLDGQPNYRLPLFDLEIAPMRKSPYTRTAQNEFAMQLFQMGFFNPAMADQAMSALQLMDFDEKDQVIQRVSMNQTLLGQVQQLQGLVVQLASGLDRVNGGDTAQQFAAMFGMDPMQQPMPQGQGGSRPAEIKDDTEESSVTKNARQRVAESTEPR